MGENISCLGLMAYLDELVRLKFCRSRDLSKHFGRHLFRDYCRFVFASELIEPESSFRHRFSFSGISSQTVQETILAQLHQTCLGEGDRSFVVVCVIVQKGLEAVV